MESDERVRVQCDICLEMKVDGNSHYFHFENLLSYGADDRADWEGWACGECKKLFQDPQALQWKNLNARLRLNSPESSSRS